MRWLPPSRYFRDERILVISCLVPLLVFLPPAQTQASCRTSSGKPMCCRGRQPACSGYSYTEDASNRTVNPLRTASHSAYYQTHSLRASGRTDLQRCFCDEHCTQTMDCCSDYRELCHKPATDCQVSEWGPWTTCNRQCGPGVSVRRRRMTQPATNGGRHCPVLEETKSCQGYRCSSRRVGRSGTLMVPFMHQARAEVAHLLPMRDDVLGLTRRWDMRWDVRRKLYLGRLIKQNKTEQPEPDPYCVVYEITHTSPACQDRDLLWSNANGVSYALPYQQTWNNWQSNTYTFNRPSSPGVATHGVNSWHESQYPYRHRRRRRSVTSGRGTQPQPWAYASEWGPITDWNSDWSSSVNMFSQGQQVCVICYPGYMREDLGFRCTGTGLLNVETRWRALKTADCHGRYRMINMPQRACTCGEGSPSFIFV